MKDVRIIFMGTPVFAAKILEYLIKEKLNIVGVVSQPDRQKDRKGNLLPTDVKRVAVANNLKIYQPEKIKDDKSFLEDLKPELIITAAYGQIVDQEVLKYPKYGCINVHGSLLPKYRGGAPIHYAVLNGDNKTGVTIMEMVSKMDAGDIISQEEFVIKEDDTLLEVHDNMIGIAQNLLIKTLPKVVNQDYVGISQDESLVSYSPNISKEMQVVDFSKDGKEIYNKIRAFNPWPVAYSNIHGKRFKFYKTEYIENGNENNLGKILSISKDGIVIGVKGGHLNVKEFQIQGKKKMKVEEFINGNNILHEKDEFE